MPRNLGRKTQGQNRASTEAALLKRAVITIPAKDWEGFKAWIERPAETIPALDSRDDATFAPDLCTEKSLIDQGLFSCA